MWSRFFKTRTAFRRMLITGSISTYAAVGISATDKTQAMTENRILSDRHRIALASWTINQASQWDKTDDRINTLDALIKYLQNTGYDGVECAYKYFDEMYFSNSKLSKQQIATIIKHKFDAAGLKVFGFTSHSLNESWNKENMDQYLKELKQIISLNKILGAEYVTFQIFLPDKYMFGDGSYRNNEELLQEFVQRIKILQQICYEQAMNFYVEAHVQRISEDPEAFSKIIDYFEKYGDFEINGDLSHFISRGMLKGPFVEKILDKMEHTHVRMARVYGDLSSEVDDPSKDWQNPNGVTKTYWNFSKKGFNNGLSSRVIVGESGPYQLVKDALKQDEKLVPLLRAMANYCDSQVEYGTDNFNPFEAKVPNNNV